MTYTVQHTPKSRIKQWLSDYSGFIVIAAVYAGLFAVMGDEGWRFWVPLVAMILIYASAPVIVSAHLFLGVTGLWSAFSLVVKKRVQ